ncbi:BCCT family transporter [Clostridium rectalis]|uniref:BCCT family transporter n=1 Tax=Clostridium rectalis TaxID=2040295 RepID=UPI000F63FF41|nr:BCCT family transporter [Clostridium rectalis]
MSNKVKKLKSSLDKQTFIAAVGIILLISVPLVLFPEKGENIINKAFGFSTNNLGFVYIWFGIIAFIMLLWVAFGKYGKIMLGDPKEKPQFSTFSWAAMLFCSGIGSSIMYWGVIEWAYYYKAPPLGIQPGTWKAAEVAATYGMFHWGPMAWAIYTVCALPLGYSYFVRKKPVLKISEVCRGVLGNKVDGILGKIIDVFFIVGLLAGAGTTLGLGTPLAATGISRLTGIPNSFSLNMAVLIIITCIFACSAYSGLKKGIKVLSDINVVGMIILLLFVFMAGPTVFILKMGTTSVGILAQNFIRMSTWLDPVIGSGFPEKWTVFYWAWWIVYSPFMGLFIAKVSRGRTFKNIILGSLGYGSLGCAVFFIILGNYSMYLDLNNILPVSKLLVEQGAPNTIIDSLQTLPLGNLAVALFIFVAVVFMATTFDSASYTIATVTTKEIRSDEEPARWNRLFWAFALSILPAALLLVDGPLQAFQTVSIVGAFPVVLIIATAMVSFFRELKKDERTVGLNYAHVEDYKNYKTKRDSV